MPIYTDVGEPGISTSPESEDFIYMFLSKEPERFTREEFDWFIAVNAFDYSVAQVVVVDTITGEAKLYYRVDIADEYAWYANEGTGLLDRTMGDLDQKGIGEPYDIRGSSSINMLMFNVQDDLIIDEQGRRFNFDDDTP